MLLTGNNGANVSTSTFGAGDRAGVMGGGVPVIEAESSSLLLY